MLLINVPRPQPMNVMLVHFKVKKLNRGNPKNIEENWEILWGKQNGQSSVQWGFKVVRASKLKYLNFCPNFPQGNFKPPPFEIKNKNQGSPCKMWY